MKKEIEITVFPDFINDNEKIKSIICKKLEIDSAELKGYKKIRQSIDARKTPVFKLRVNAFINETPPENEYKIEYKNVTGSDKIIVIVGSGPAGLFAALRCLELGIKPVVLERGKDVRARRRDLKAIHQNGIVDSDSNYCFGEGGAGTYSDGKLYTRSTKRGDIKNILNTLHFHGAQNEILYEAHPHIGSNILPKVVASIRDTIINHGGEYHFESKVTNLLISDNKINGVIVNDKSEFTGDAVILATGHSARDIYHILRDNKVKMERKEFAMGVRIEHPQMLIDSIQYKMKSKHENLPPSPYSIKCQADGRGVYSFCMCPGGIIIPASTEQEGLVLNGMSISRRNSPFANSGLVVTVKDEDLKDYIEDYGLFAGVEYQKHFEEKALFAGGGKHSAPAQRITDFVNFKTSSTLPETSYIPGTVSHPLHELIPKPISKRLRYSLNYFAKNIKGYFTEEAQILAAETRTSSPLRIPRDKETLMHVHLNGLFPSGEGAGYAGGIVSAAIDGENCASAAIRYVLG